MKVYKLYIRNLLVVGILITICTATAFSQTRSTIWLDGSTNTTSHGWGGVPNIYYDLAGFDFVDINIDNTNSNIAYDLNLGVFGAASQMEPQLDGHENVLGIAHDMGGLVLRDLANKDNSLSAMILNGVPNQGSAAINFATEIQVGDKTKVQLMIDGVQDIIADEECENCNLIEAFQEWMDEVENNRDVLRQMRRGSEEVNTLNASPPDNTPFVVLWGSVEELPISTMLSSRNFPATGDDDHYTECYARRLAKRKKENQEDFVLETIDNVVNFYGSYLEYIGTVFAEPTEIISAVGDFIKDAKNSITGQIEDVRDRDQELASILRCEAAVQILNVEWNYALNEFGSLTTEEVEIGPDIVYCEQQCWEQFEGTTPNHAQFGACVADCMNSDNTPVLTETVYVAVESDGLLLETEQKLSGAVDEYHLYEHNHFQETKLSSNSGVGTLNHALDELFSGSAGPAFTIPKQ
ncbi:MAG: hypothetical protein GVY26_08505 [Bacteroidetes bacterium]|jgi:hypothetical protein|nr:hypothetical protein [Bacteroidota bacterium]